MNLLGVHTLNDGKNCQTYYNVELKYHLMNLDVSSVESIYMRIESVFKMYIMMTDIMVMVKNVVYVGEYMIIQIQMIGAMTHTKYVYIVEKI
jgi:hypothetical protein